MIRRSFPPGYTVVDGVARENSNGGDQWRYKTEDAVSLDNSTREFWHGCLVVHQASPLANHWCEYCRCYRGHGS